MLGVPSLLAQVCLLPLQTLRKSQKKRNEKKIIIITKNKKQKIKSQNHWSLRNPAGQAQHEQGQSAVTSTVARGRPGERVQRKRSLASTVLSP